MNLSKRSTFAAAKPETSAGTRDRLFALAALTAMAVQAMLGPTAPPLAHALAALASALVALASFRWAKAESASLACLLACVTCAASTRMPWQLAMLVALVVFMALGRWSTRLRLSSAWRARGEVPRGWTLVVGGVTPFGLVGWLVVMRPDLRDVVDGYLPALPLSVLVAGAVLFAIVNATLEEMIWRGVVQHELGALFGGGGVIAIQAASFGLQHAWGFPRGVVGVLLAGIWAVMLGLLRRRSGGLLAPIVAHVVADATIAVLVLGVVRRA